MALIRISELSFGHDGGPTLFSKIFLQLDTNWKLGLLGRNGRGKTTFLKLLTGELPYSGKIQSSVAFEYFPFVVEKPQWTALQLAKRICPDAAQWQLEREASLIELSPEALTRSMATLSGGETTKLLLALLFLRENNFPLIDEPTTHLDLRGRQAVGKYLLRKKGFILVSHDRSLLDDCIDHVLSINKASIELQQGNFSSWYRNRLHQDRYEQAQHRKLQKEVSRLAKSANQSTIWAGRVEKEKYGNGPVDRGYIGHKAAKMMQRAKAVDARRQMALDAASQLLKNVETAAAPSMRSLPYPGKTLLEASGLAIAHDGKRPGRGLSFRVQNGDRLVVQGANGSGKSSLARLLARHPLPFLGNLHVPGNLRISYVPQDTSFLEGSLQDFAREQGIDVSFYRAVLDRLGFDFRNLATALAQFSAGQKKKALLASSLCQEAHLYIWDEPLNSIDMPSRMQLEELILESRPTMVLIEHDQVFTQRVGTAFLDLDQAQNAGLDPEAAP